eukprot:TRINITY_DN5568_c0_g1_i1.p1 TRINITY_DN5568_c0_g1~~TRINITY_DN5568_c0_g1_i1.p1  ORF type:complete len:349 (+),score=107.43 TRINITY_DN5568_c0_g1_i1:66-1112(+)
MSVKAIAFKSAEGKAEPHNIERREVGDNDIQLEILYAGICHSDIHTVRNEWGGAKYPCVPGHEIVGRVLAVGSKVTKLKVGDLGGVGCMVNSCRDCNKCNEGTEQFCKKCVLTYNSLDKDGKITYGGYSTQIVTDQHFVLKVSSAFKDLKGVAPLLCAGITTFSPLHAHKNKVVGKRVGVVGLGGLGHMGIKFAVSMGADVTVFSTSASKEADAKRMGAQHFVVSKDQEEMKKRAGTFDFILDTIAAQHPFEDYLKLLDVGGVICVLGAAPKPLEFSAMTLLMQNKTIVGSLIGGIEETQIMLDYCAEKDIICDYELIGVDKIDEAYERTVASDVKYRFVIDIDTLRK